LFGPRSEREYRSKQPLIQRLYTAAGILRRCSSLVEGHTQLPESQRNERAQAYTDRPMAALRQAVQSGYKDLARTRKDHDLDPLRARADFQKLPNQPAILNPSREFCWYSAKSEL
jgi:hypothetical protein